MDRLILMRHGQAERHAATGGDFERGLTAGPRRRRPDGPIAGLPRRRARTWSWPPAPGGPVRRRRLSPPPFPSARAEFRRDLYHAEPEEVVAALEDEGEPFGTVMIVGHNPGLHELALRLAIQGGAEPVSFNKIRGRFPTATTVVFAFGSGGPPMLEPSVLCVRTWRSGRRMTLIYKILPRAEWDAAARPDVFEGSAVDLADGFIHLSGADQAQDTAALWFAGQPDLILLVSRPTAWAKR
jgi:phosphohistidine phosphatase